MCTPIRQYTGNIETLETKNKRFKSNGEYECRS